jgi:hypothetical protein
MNSSAPHARTMIGGNQAAAPPAGVHATRGERSMSADNMLQQRNTEPRLRWNGNVALVTGLSCPWCGCEIRNDFREIANGGWRLVCDSPRGCHRTILICEG